MNRAKGVGALCLGGLLAACGGGDGSPPVYPGMNAPLAVSPAQDGIAMRELDARGELVRSVEVGSGDTSPAGPDGLFFTGDDRIDGYFEKGAFSDSVRNRQASFSGPGPDGLWYTADDEVSGYGETLTLYAPPRRIEYWAFDPGSDGQWFNADDSPENHYVESERDDDGRDRRHTIFYGGPDGLRFTDDDVVSSSSAYEDTPRGRAWVERSGFGSTVGSLPMPPISSYTIPYSDSSGRDVQMTYGTGQDNEAFTADDEAGGFLATSYDTSGRPLRYEYGRVGSDGQFDTGDDYFDGIKTWEYADDGSTLFSTWGYFSSFRPGELSDRESTRTDSGGREIERLFYPDAGPDETWFTPDDVVGSRKLITYDASGSEVQQIWYDGPGRDGRWLTDDDDIASYGITRYGLSGGEISYQSFGSPGPDERWFTADDLAWGYTVRRPGFFGGDEVAFISYAIKQSDPDATRTERVVYYLVERESQVGDVTIREFFSFHAPGPDGTWFTGDDDQSWHSVIVTRIRTAE